MVQFRWVFQIAFAATLAGCGSGGTADDPATGSLTIGLTDAPIDSVEDVTVSMVGVTAKPQNGPQISWTFDAPREIKLLDLTGGVSETLLLNEPVPAGPYNWIRFDIDPDASASYVILDSSGGEIPLRVPSDRLRFVNGFTITANQTTDFMVDWDVRKGLTDPVGQATVTLRPAFRVTDMTAYATIAGTVADALVEDDRATGGCGDYDPNTLEGNVVYLYPLTENRNELDDIFLDDTTEEGPMATAQVTWNDGMTGYEYRIDYVSADPGEDGMADDYTLAFTCQGASDSAESQDDIAFRGFVDVPDLMHGQDVLTADFD